MTKSVLTTAFSFPVFLGAVLAATVYHFANRGVADPDIWWHLRNAEYLFQAHHFIRSDLYSYTVAGASWINHEWLAEIPFYLGWRAWGLQGIFLTMICLIEIIMLGAYYLGCLVSGNSKSAFLASWVAMFLATISFGPRTLLVGWIFLIVLIGVLWRYRRDGKDRLWLLPPLFLLWVNSHGSWLIGMAVLWIFILSGLIEFTGPSLESTRWTRVQLQRLLRAAGASVLALFVNPYGYNLVLYPFDLAFRQKLNISHIEEWASADFHTLRGKILLGSILLVLAITVIRRQRWRLEWLALFLFGIYASVTYARFIFLAAIIFTPIVACRLDMVPAYDRDKDKPLLNAAFIIAAVAFIIWRFPTASTLSADVEQIYPAQAIARVEAQVHQAPGRVLNSYQWGGYMILNARDIPVFIDSRVDVYEYHGILKDYLDFINLNGSLKVLDQHKIRYVFLEAPSAQAYVLDHLAGWRATYRDHVATLYERTSE